MERNKLLGWIVAVAVLLGLGVYFATRDDAGDSDEAGQQANNNAGDAPARPGAAVRRASQRPDPIGQAKAAIAGTVRDREGQPISGAQVCVWAAIADLDGVPPGQPRCSRSEADGHYRLDGLWPARAIVNAEARGYLPQRWFGRHESYREEQLSLRAGQTREGVDFVLQPGGVEVKGVVRDISGGVIEGAFVWVGGNMFDDSGRSVSVSDGDGRFSLWTGPGRIVVNAEADGYAPGERFSAAPGATLEVVLTPESVVSGRVVLAGTQEPVAGVVVHAEGESFFSAGEGRARSDDAGNFRIDKLEPGIYVLDARGDELYGEAPELVHLGLAQTVDGVVIELHPAVLVSGEVVIAGGPEPRPCPQGGVRLTDKADKANSRWGRISDGEVELRSVLPGSYAVQVTCEGTIAEPEYADLEVVAGLAGQRWEVREGLAIRGEVVDADGDPVEGAQVFVQMKVDAEDPRAQISRAICPPTLADGQFTAAGLLPGSYEVKTFALNGAAAEPVTVELDAGADVNDVRLVTPASGGVRGVVRDAEGQPVVGVTVLARPLEQRANLIGVSDDEGRFTIDQVPPGEARVTAREGMAVLRAPGTGDDDEQGVVAQVGAGEVAEVELVVESRAATIRGRVLDEHGSPVADAFVSHQRESDSVSAAKGAGKRRLRWSFEDRPVLTDVDGNFVIEGVAADASYVIGAFRKGGGEAVQDGVRPGASVELTIVDTGELAGKIVDGQGEPVDAAVKLTLSNQAEGLSRTQTLFRTGGAFRLAELPPGSYTLVADSPRGAARIEGIELAGGEQKTDLVVTLTGRVTVRGRLIDIDTREPVPGMAVKFGARNTSMSFGDEKGGGENPHISDADGRFEVADAPTGKVTIAVTPRSFGDDNRYSWLWTSFFVPEGEGVVDIGDVELVADRVQRDQKPGDIGFEIKQSEPDRAPEDFVATVSLIRPGGPAEQSGLAVGDQIETVNGHDVRGINSVRYYRLTKVAPGDSFELGVAGGKKVTITAGPAIE